MRHTPIVDAYKHLLLRIYAEYLEMPGLRVTSRQAARLFGASEPHCAKVLDELVARQVLRRQPNGMYVRPSDGRRLFAESEGTIGDDTLQRTA